MGSGLAALVTLLGHHPELYHRLEVESIQRFIRLAKLCRGAIQLGQKQIDIPPLVLPDHVHRFLCLAMNLEFMDVARCWEALAEVVWESSDILATEGDIQAFHMHGLQHGLGYRDLYAPYHTCPSCTLEDGKSVRLTEASTYKATLFTASEGSLPVHIISVYCRKCHTRFYNNYAIHKNTSLRQYYGSVPNVVEVAKHFFIESRLLEMFATQMCFQWCKYAFINNNPVAFGTMPAFHTTGIPWQTSLLMRTQDVLDGFFLYSLLLYKAEKREVLVVPHEGPSQAARLEKELKARNSTMEGTGQEEYLHACDLCCKIWQDENGVWRKLQAVVTDGNTMGHPCCAVHNCHNPLANTRRRYCPTHEDLNALCAVDGCRRKASEGQQTCPEPDHRKLEDAYRQRGKALFQLRERLAKAGFMIPEDTLSGEVADNDEVEVEGQGGREIGCEGKSPAGNIKVRARFGRRRTHNEQLFVRPCGVILSRATLFGAEAVSSVKELAKATFPTAASTPELLIYDDGCRLRAHLIASGDTHFANTGTPVDVFHFTRKHKTTDHACQMFCNPASFSGLVDQNGNWVFNTSIAEQTNVWFGAFQSIVREMEVVR
ncbi:hypothetical protein GLOTRDRAFT_51546, partial [Gloeophyllum trabeum ATCC 11539]